MITATTLKAMDYLLTRLMLLVMLGVIVPAAGFSQALTSFEDDFEDGSVDTTWNGSTHTMWVTTDAAVYDITEANGVLDISYSRNGQAGGDEYVLFIPPEEIDVSASPVIRVDIRADKPTTLTLKTLYSAIPVVRGEQQRRLPGDDSWHTYAFRLEEENYSFDPLNNVSFYFDEDQSVFTEKNIQLDNLKIAGHLIEVTDLSVSMKSVGRSELSWSSDDPEAVEHYNIYRSTEANFDANLQAKVGESSSTSFTDQGLETYQTYYYKVSAVDTAGTWHLPSDEARLETYDPDVTPGIEIVSSNRNEVPRYEKFELKLNLENVYYTNPFDPEDIDVHGWFRSPEGDTMRVNGFYDDYQNRDQWKLRFSPNQTGSWEYQVFVTDVSGTGKSAKGTFTAVESAHHGWIKPSPQNPRYFMHDDGTTFYGVGVYSPWGNSQSRFDKFAEQNANLFAIWNINYGGFINSTGMFENELGRYNQEKAGRLDSLLSILERHDMKLMYAIWPHDLFSATVWAHQWDNNPYNQLIDVADVYSDSLVWEYQEQQYRYLIARYGHSRSMGIWEIINEMNGTDGWQQGRHEEAYRWVENVDQYFEEHDPYNHPTTASFSGGFNEYRSRLYETNDIPNLHIYPVQGWNQQYPNDVMRSSMYNFAFGARRFWNNFEKPALYGEAGADLTYYDPGTANYTLAYHNAIWATLTNGMAAAPVWWQYTHMSDDMWAYMSYLRDFTSDINFAHAGYGPTTLEVHHSDNYAFEADSAAFGWSRSYEGQDIAGRNLRLHGLETGTFELEWFNTWTGQVVGMDTLVAGEGVLASSIPPMDRERPDIAFKTKRIENGTEASRLGLYFKEPRIQLQADSVYTLITYVADDEGRLVTTASGQIQFSLTGPGRLSAQSAAVTGGVATVQYTPDEGTTGPITISAEREGLESAELNEEVLTSIGEVKDGALPADFRLGDNYPNPFNPTTRINYSLPEAATVSLKVYDLTGREIRTLVAARKGAGEHSVQFESGGLSSGVYFYRLETGSFTQVKRMTLLK